MNKCGNCRACCRALGVEELDKPAWKMCDHVCRTGCGIYNDRPESCRIYSCEWLKTQESPEPLPAKLRPDRCGVILDTLISLPEDTVIARVAPGNTKVLSNALVVKVIDLLTKDGIKVHVVMGDKVSKPVRLLSSKHRPRKPVVIGSMVSKEQ